MIVLTNGQIITEFQVLQGYDVWLSGNTIDAIVPHGERSHAQATTVIDVNGGWVAPGLIDLHSDYIEFMAAPRPSVMLDFQLSLRETEKQLIGHGITMMYHSLSLWANDLFEYKPIRDPKNVYKLVDAIHDTHTSKHLLRHRFHARFEIDNVEGTEQLIRLIREQKVHLVSFMDHTPGQGQFRNLEMYRYTLKGYRGALSDAELDGIIATHQNKDKLTWSKIAEISALAAEYEISIASHDDDTTEKIDLVRSFGTTLSEFPITMEVAEYARLQGMATMAGAPNVLLGGSHSGNLNAAEAIKKQAIDILCSDYFPAGLLNAVFKMHHQHGLELHDAFKLVTINPARAVGIDREFGSVASGKRADLIVLEQLDGHYPVVTNVLVDGKIVQTTNYRI
jgi:alpha-D-ribose 1-methylphosphonate 5-triphosphate diphosphatase